MYRISDQQIDYILNDISARGVEMESLQQNLLDHICCIIENNLEENGDFESFYKKTIQHFYKDELWEIEEETLLLLTYKNYYTMKKIMIYSGTFSAAALIFGILFKFMHWPGAAMLIILGIGISSLIFLPLLFTLKLKEQQTISDKIALALITSSGILLCLSVLFKVMHWPGANMMGVAFIVILGLLFLPLNFYSGIRKPERKVNNITTSILIIIFCGLWLTLIRTPQATRFQNIDSTYTLYREQQLLDQAMKDLQKLQNDSSAKDVVLSKQILNLCTSIKTMIIIDEIGLEKISEDFESKNIFIAPRDMVNLIETNSEINLKIANLYKLVEQYNHQFATSRKNLLPVKGSFLEYSKNQKLKVMNNISLLSQINNLQMFVILNYSS